MAFAWTLLSRISFSNPYVLHTLWIHIDLSISLLWFLLFSFAGRCWQWTGSSLAEKESRSPTAVEREREGVNFCFWNSVIEKRQCGPGTNILIRSVVLFRMWSNLRCLLYCFEVHFYISCFAHWTIAAVCDQLCFICGLYGGSN